MTAVGVGVAVSVALSALVVGPVLAVCLYVIGWRDPAAIERAVLDVQRFNDLRDRARAELAATGSLDDFVAAKEEARAHLWRPSSGSRTNEHLAAALPNRSSAATIERRRNGREESAHEHRRTAVPPFDSTASG